MVAKRLVESVLFLETRCNSDADKEYVEAIRRVIEEHALLRETLENICLEKNIEDIFVMASSVLGQAAGNTIDANASLNEALSKISKLLPSDKQLEEMSNAKLLIGELLA
jgi:glutathionylspermidine synthase